MSRPRSLRPRKTPRSQQLGAVVRMLGRPEPGLLEAALEPEGAQEILENAKADSAEALLAIAMAVCLEAHDSWQRMTTEQRTHVRGFSLRLLALAGDQALTLERVHAEHAALSTEYELAVTRLRELGPRGALLSSQARDVLERVAGDGAALDEQVPREPPNTMFGLAQTLHRLAHAGQELLRSSNTAVRKRALLYGLNDAFLDGIAAAGAELVRVNEKACATAPLQQSRQALDHAHRATFFLVHRIAEAFATAHAIDKTVPVLASAPKTKPAAMHTLAPATRGPQVVVLESSHPKNTSRLGSLGRSTAKMVSPAPAPRVLDASDMDASGMIRKRSKPPFR